MSTLEGWNWPGHISFCLLLLVTNESANQMNLLTFPKRINPLPSAPAQLMEPPPSAARTKNAGVVLNPFLSSCTRKPETMLALLKKYKKEGSGWKWKNV